MGVHAMAERKIGRGRAEITCKNNNGREYRITRSFLSFIDFRVREGEKRREEAREENPRLYKIVPTLRSYR